MPVPRYPWIKNCRVGNSIIGFWIKLIVFVIERLKDQSDHEKDWIAPIDLFKRLTRSIRSWWIFFSKIDERESIPSIFEKDWRTKMYGSDLLFWHWKREKLSKTEDKYVFLMELLLFCDRKINSTVKKIVITLFNLF